MKKFCSECGKGVEYKFSPPKFCSDCGAPMGIASVNEAKPLSREVSRRTQQRAVANADGYTDSEYVPDISRLEYEVETYGNQMTLGQMAGHGTPHRGVSRRRTKSKNIQDFIDDKDV